jgi:hypothetical protein
MSQRVGDGRLFKLFKRPISQWSAACGENDSIDKLDAFERLEYCAMLGIDRDDFGTGFFCSRQKQFTRDNQGFLVGQGKSFSVLYGR